MAVGINIASRKYSFPTEKQRTMMKSEWFVFSLWAISNKTRSIVLLLTKDIPSIKSSKPPAREVTKLVDVIKLKGQ